MPRVTLYVPQELRDAMEAAVDINWSAVAQQAFRRAIRGDDTAMPDHKTIHVLSCRYADNSAHTVLRAYASAERAEEDREMIEKTGPAMHPEVTAVALVEES